MRTLKTIILAVLDSDFLKSAYKSFLLYLLKDKKIYYVTGLRRSGNHAFISWLINSLEDEPTEIIKDNQYRHFHTTANSRTIFFNEVNEITTIVFFRIIFERFASIRNCKNIIISTEDCSADYTSFKIPRYDEAIFVKRSLLNMVASRIQYLLKRANDGRSNYWNAIDEEVLNKLLSLHNSDIYHKWDFENWLTSKNYRNSFLIKLGLDKASIPEVSKFGGGSSFTGTMEKPNVSDLTNRFKQIKFSNKIISYLKEDKYKNLLDEHEINFLDKKFSN